MTKEIEDLTGEEVMRMASIGCSQNEIAQKFNCSTSLVANKYKVEYQKGIVKLFELIRKAQIDCALEGKGSATMLIFLGKTYLHQTEFHAEERLSDLDLLLTHLEKQAKCSNYLKSNFEVSANPIQE